MSDYLKYTNYELIQDDELFKANTDTICLGMFLDPLYKKTVLDIGTNTGALLLYALKNNAGRLLGVDICQKALQLAKINLENYSDNFQLYHSRVQDLKIAQVDVIITNPPYFEMNNITPDEKLKDALFDGSLPIDELFSSFRRLLKSNGEVYLLYQADRFPEVYQMCLDYKFKIMKMQFIHDINSKHALRVMLKLKIGKMSKLKVYEPIMIDKGRILKQVGS